MENHQHHHPSPQPVPNHSHHATHTMPDGTVMPGVKHGSHAGHTGHDHAGMIADFLRRFWIFLVLTLPVVVISPMFQHAVGYHFDFPGRDWVSFALASVIFFYGGLPFLRGLWDEVRRGQPGMMTLIGVAISVAYLYSTAVVFGLVEGMDF